MYFSFIYTSDLIILLLEMFMFIPLAHQNEKQRQYKAKGSVSSKYIVESESKKSNVNDILN